MFCTPREEFGRRKLEMRGLSQALMTLPDFSHSEGLQQFRTTALRY